MFKVLKLFVNDYNKNIKYMTQTLYYTDEYWLIKLTINQINR